MPIIGLILQVVTLESEQLCLQACPWKKVSLDWILLYCVTSEIELPFLSNYYSFHSLLISVYCIILKRKVLCSKLASHIMFDVTFCFVYSKVKRKIISSPYKRNIGGKDDL